MDNTFNEQAMAAANEYAEDDNSRYTWHVLHAFIAGANWAASLATDVNERVQQAKDSYQTRKYNSYREAFEGGIEALNSLHTPQPVAAPTTKGLVSAQYWIDRYVELSMLVTGRIENESEVVSARVALSIIPDSSAAPAKEEAPQAAEPNIIDVDFGGNVLARIELSPFKVTAAIDGYGLRIALDTITFKSSINN